jgi:hypothetical protein
MDMLILFKRLLTKECTSMQKVRMKKCLNKKEKKPKHLKLTYLSNYLNKMGGK